MGPPQTEPPSNSLASVFLLVIYFSDIYIALSKLIVNSLNKLA